MLKVKTNACISNTIFSKDINNSKALIYYWGRFHVLRIDAEEFS